MSCDRASACTESTGVAFTFYSLRALGQAAFQLVRLVVADGHTEWSAPGPPLTSGVKRLRARLVLGSGTAWEYLRVLSAFCPQPLPQAGSSIQLVRLDAACRELQSRRAPKATRPRRGRQEQIHSRCHKRGAASSLSAWLSLTAIPSRMHRISFDLRS